LKINDYLSFLSEFDKFHLIPSHIKKSKKYKIYLQSIVNYLKNFFIRSQPLTDFTKISCNIDEQFDREWNEGILPGWEKTIKDLKDPMGEESNEINNYCIPCKKKFTNENVFKNHLKGKSHAKAINKIPNIEVLV
jgi:splicing factor 3A subunit 3